jgi:hypothetical protein
MKETGICRYQQMNLLQFNDFDINNHESMREFLDLNAMAHETIFQALLDMGIAIEHYPLQTENMTTDWLLTHNQVHTSEAIAMGIDQPTNLDSVDPADVEQMADWLNNHALDHQYKAQALGL